MLVTNDEKLMFQGHKYSLEFLKDKPYVRCLSKEGEMLTELFFASCCDTLEGTDVTSAFSPWEVEEKCDCVLFYTIADSSIWKSKKYTFLCKEDRFEYYYEVEGEGSISECKYFSGYYTGSLRWGSGKMFSGFAIDKLFNPEPDTSEQYYYHPAERSVIDVLGVPIHGKDNWFFTPPPFCFIGIKNKTMFTLGVKAAAGEYKFSEYTYSGGRGAYLSLSYEGRVRVKGIYRLPAISFILGEEEYELLKQHCDEIRVDTSKRKQYDWWKTPIFCGWGVQCSMSPKYNLPAPALAKEAFYYEFIKTIEEKGLKPGIVVIDDKWQKSYGINDVDTEKWTDMKGYIEVMHKAGRRVLLWLKAWDPEGVVSDHCITDFAGKKIAVDPTNPEYEKLFRSAIRHMLSQDGLNADGFKIDFTARIPSSPYCQTYGEAWGLELMRKYLEVIYSEAKAVKEDALVMTHTPHPYLEDVTDMIRLNDINGSSNVNDAMLHRAKVAKAACPSCIIDTDNWPMPNKQSWLDYVKLQPALGVPSLYYLWNIDSTGEKITDEDFELVKKAWKESLGKKGCGDE